MKTKYDKKCIECIELEFLKAYALPKCQTKDGVKMAVEVAKWFGYSVSEIKDISNQVLAKITRMQNMGVTVITPELFRLIYNGIDTNTPALKT